MSASLTGHWRSGQWGKTPIFAVAALPAQVEAALGPVDGIINNAGIIQPFVHIKDLTRDQANRVMNVKNQLTEFSVKSVTEGIDAQGEVTIRIEADGGAYTGRAADTDILVASARAYLHALNRSIATPAGAVPEPAGERN